MKDGLWEQGLQWKICKSAYYSNENKIHKQGRIYKTLGPFRFLLKKIWSFYSQVMVKIKFMWTKKCFLKNI